MCDGCHKLIEGKVLLCASCKTTRYHNSECQKKHWKEHKKICKQTKHKVFRSSDKNRLNDTINIMHNENTNGYRFRKKYQNIGISPKGGQQVVIMAVNNFDEFQEWCRRSDDPDLKEIDNMFTFISVGNFETFEKNVANINPSVVNMVKIALKQTKKVWVVSSKTGHGGKGPQTIVANFHTVFDD